jgi:hypothetical protein
VPHQERTLQLIIATLNYRGPLTVEASNRTGAIAAIAEDAG